MATPALILHVFYVAEGIEAYHTLEWGDKLEYDSRGFLFLDSSMRATSERAARTPLGHADTIREIKIIPEKRPVSPFPEGWDIDALRGRKAV